MGNNTNLPICAVLPISARFACCGTQILLIKNDVETKNTTTRRAVQSRAGYAEKGASVHAVELFKKHLPQGIQIKASGGIRAYEFAKELVEAGATRLGCSASVAIVSGGH